MTAALAPLSLTRTPQLPDKNERENAAAASTRD